MVEPTYTRDDLEVVFRIPGKLRTLHDPSLHLVLDAWEDFFVTVDEFRAFLFDWAIPFAKRHRIDTWIVDSSAARGVLRPEVQCLSEERGYGEFAAAGVRRMIWIAPGNSPLARMSSRSSQRKAQAQGIEAFEVGSMAAAFEYARTHPL